MAFAPGGTLTDWTLVNGMAWLQLWERNAEAVAACRAIGPIQASQLIPKGVVNKVRFPAVVVVRVRDPEKGVIHVVSVTGTKTPLQWVQNFLLIPPGTTVPRMPGAVHGYFRDAASALYPQIREFTDEEPDAPVYLVGHSLGGAIAQALVQRFRFDGKQAWAYAAGSPAVGDRDFANDVADYVFRLENEGDPVPTVPPAQQDGTGNWFGLNVALGKYAYAPAGRGDQLNRDGTVTLGTHPVGGAAAAIVILKNFGKDHLPDTYLERLGHQWLTQDYLQRGANGYADPYSLAELLSVKLPEELPPPPPPAPLPPPPVIPEYAKGPAFPADPPGSPGPFPPPHAALPLPKPSPGVHMGTPAVPLPQQAYRFLIRFNMGSWGWTETYLFGYATPTFAAALDDAANLASLRRSVLNADASIYGYRVQEYGGDPPHGSQFISDAALGCGPGEVTDELVLLGSTEPVWDTALFTFYDDTRQYRRPLFVRGVPSQYVVWKISGDPGLTAEGQGPMTDFGRKVISTDPNVGFKGRLVIHGRSRDPAVTFPQRVERAATNPLCGTDVVTNQEPHWAPGDVVHIHQKGCDQCPVKGMSGDSCVLDTKINEDSSFTTTIGRRPCCCGEPIQLPTETTISLVVKQFYPAANVSIGRLTSRATGAGFGAGRGRARGCRR